MRVKPLLTLKEAISLLKVLNSVKPIVYRERYTFLRAVKRIKLSIIRYNHDKAKQPKRTKTFPGRRIDD